MITRNIVRENMYLDSIMLMSLSSTLKELEGVDEASVIMGSETNKEILEGIGLLTEEGRGVKPGDVIIAVRAKDRKVVDQVEAQVEELLSVRSVENHERKVQLPRSFEAAIESFPAANLALISLPGQYAGREAMKVLESGRHVMIFSDNVPLEEEILLKKLARDLGLLVMGPDCGTAIINGTALGFANVVRRGPFGIIGASGTGIQEISVLLHRKGYGITQAIGLGGRDLSREVEAMSMLQAIEALEHDTESRVILLISKPPDPEVAHLIFDTVRRKKKEYIITFLNGDSEEAGRRGLHFASGLEEAVHQAIALHGFDLSSEDSTEALRRLKGIAGSFSGDLNSFLDALSLERGIDHATLSGDRVALMSLHAAKGLEWPVVFITGCEDQLIPCRLFGDRDDEEEKRLFYVGMTRARSKLFLSSASRRTLNGRVLQMKPSPFLDLIPERFCEPVERSAWKRKEKTPKQLGLF